VSSPQVKDLHPESYSAFDQSDSKVTQHIGSFRQHPLFAILRTEERGLPKVTSSEEFDGGKLTGNLVVARVDTGAVICSIPVSAQSASNVKFKERASRRSSPCRSIAVGGAPPRARYFRRVGPRRLRRCRHRGARAPRALTRAA
jgi:hypothetical protein